MAEFRSKKLDIRLSERFSLTGRKYAFLGRRARADRFGNVLFNSVLQFRILIFFQSITARLYPVNRRSFSCAFHFDDSSDKCQTKSCFEDKNILIEAIFKICTTNQFFKQELICVTLFSSKVKNK